MLPDIELPASDSLVTGSEPQIELPVLDSLMTGSDSNSRTVLGGVHPGRGGRGARKLSAVATLPGFVPIC